jgi:hypothetical protein
MRFDYDLILCTEETWFFCILLCKSQYLRLQTEASEASLRSRQVEQAGVKGGSKKWRRS